MIIQLNIGDNNQQKADYRCQQQSYFIVVHGLCIHIGRE